MKTPKVEKRPARFPILQKWRAWQPGVRHMLLTLLLVLLSICITALIVGGTFSGETRSRTVSLRLKNLGELTTQSCTYTNVQVIRNSRQVLGITVPFTQSHYIYSYDGEIKAGIDFSKVTFAVDEPNRQITISMPPVQVFSNEIDQDSLTIYDEEKNIFTPLKLTNLNDSLTQLKTESEASAVANGLLENAMTNAETLVISFLSSAYDPEVYSFQCVTAAEPD